MYDCSLCAIRYQNIGYAFSSSCLREQATHLYYIFKTIGAKFCAKFDSRTDSRSRNFGSFCWFLFAIQSFRIRKTIYILFMQRKRARNTRARSDPTPPDATHSARARTRCVCFAHPSHTHPICNTDTNTICTLFSTSTYGSFHPSIYNSPDSLFFFCIDKLFAKSLFPLKSLNPLVSWKFTSIFVRSDNKLELA